MRRLVTFGALELRVQWLIALCVCLSVTVLLNLGFWQLDRAEEKRSLQRAMLARQDEPPLPLASLPVTFSPLTHEQQQQLENLSVSFSGSYWNEASFLVAFQFLQGAPGFELITPFTLSSGHHILVSRGWISPGNEGEPTIPPVIGVTTLTGQLHIPATISGVTQVEGDIWPIRFRRLDIALASELMDKPLLPYVIRLAEGQPGVLARHWPALTISTRSNIQYALQWFGMALAVVVVTLLMSTNALTLWRSRVGRNVRAGVNPRGSG